jgi:hypothetical protein
MVRFTISLPLRFIPLVFGRAEDAYKMEDVLTLMLSPSSQEIFLALAKLNPS